MSTSDSAFDATADEAASPYAPFRPRRGRWVAIGAAVVAVSVFGVGAVVTPGPVGAAAWTPGDRVMFFGFGLAIAWLLWRYASIRATPSPERLVVRNLLLTRSVPWTDIVGIQFAGADPWLRLDLADTEQLAVMAIQRVDGRRGQTEAARLAALVEVLAGPPETD